MVEIELDTKFGTQKIRERGNNWIVCSLFILCTSGSLEYRENLVGCSYK